MLGPEICEKATNGAKKFEVTVSNDAVEDVFGHGFSKSLRYGATLELVKVLSTLGYTKLLQFCQHAPPFLVMSSLEHSLLVKSS